VSAPVLSVSALTVTYGRRPVLDGVDLDLVAGRVHVVLGASGSGKTTLLRALVGMVPAPGRVSARRLLLRTAGGEVDLSTSDAWRRVRGRHVGLIAQDPAQALTPLRRAASLVREADRLAGGAADRARVERILRAAGFADPRAVASRYCFELSGGMAQRLGVGLAVAPRPAVLLADEPSTALDGIARARLAATLREVAGDGAAVVLVTHDEALAAGLADDLTTLHNGRVVETVPRRQSSRRLVVSVPPARGRGAGMLSVRGLRKRYRGTGTVLDGVDLDVADGEVVGIAGRSGAGKTTLLRFLVGLERPDGGELRIGGRTPAEAGWRALRRLVQIVPQDPHGSLNPWRTARDLVADPLDAHRIGTRAERRARADELLDRVGLAGLEHRRPGQLSTGQCQRVAIARALASRPRLLVADEPVTALDAPLRQDILDLLSDLVREHGMAALVISHDLYVLEALCHRIAVLDAGRIVEDLPAAALRDDGTHPLTRALIECHPTGENA
jgi:peptide/nickel transport system ATP-binding protein